MTGTSRPSFGGNVHSRAAPYTVVSRLVDESIYDADHNGWNEFHPVKTIQRIDESCYDAATSATCADAGAACRPSCRPISWRATRNRT
jgi:hypothetical protein